MTEHKVLWIDDEPDSNFIERCQRRGIVLVPKKVRNEGIQELKANPTLYSGVILDVKMPKSQENEVASIDGFAEIKDEALSQKIPYFIYTGQPDIYSENWFTTTYKTFYHKGSCGDGELGEDELIRDMLDEFSKNQDRIVENIYENVFASLSKFGDIYQKAGLDILVPILKNIHYPVRDFKPSLHYNRLRIMIEYLFRIFNDKKILPDEFIPQGAVNINQSYYYLKGGNPDIIRFRYGNDKSEGTDADRVVPQYIEQILWPIISLGNNQSHSVQITGDDEKKITSFFEKQDAQYLIMGYALQLCEVIKWMDKNIDNIPYEGKKTPLPPKEDNKSQEQSQVVPIDIIEKYEGKVFDALYCDKGFWYVDNMILPCKKGNTLKKVKLQQITCNTSTNKEQFPYFAKYEIIQ